MAIPAGILSDCKSLLRITDTGRDTQIQRVFERVLHALCREVEWFTERENISALTSAHTYTTTSRAVRTLAILHNGVQIYKTTARQMDYLRNTWISDAGGTPELWWQDKIPILDGVGEFNAETFSVYPAPSANATSTAGFTVYMSAIPDSDAPTPTWITPYLVYRTAGEFLRESAEERLDETDTALSQFWLATADLWIKMLKKRLSLVNKPSQGVQNVGGRQW